MSVGDLMSTPGEFSTLVFPYKFNYYALNKILNSDWSNTNLTLVDVWLAGRQC